VAAGYFGCPPLQSIFRLAAADWRQQTNFRRPNQRAHPMRALLTSGLSGALHPFVEVPARFRRLRPFMEVRLCLCRFLAVPFRLRSPRHLEVETH
jgi:hypothetical protein